MTTILTNVRLLADKGLTDPVSVRIDSETITSITPELPDSGNAHIVDGAGATLLPGLIDAHVHISGRGDLDALASNGVTTGIDMASWPAATTAALRGGTGTASLVSAGVPFIGPAGPHSRFGMPSYAIVTDPADVADGVARRVADGSDFIKIVAEAPGRGGPDPEIVRLVVAAAHATGVMVVAHASHIDAFTMSLDAGADIVTHVPTEDAITAAIADGMADRGRTAIPTLSVAEILTAAMPRPGANYDNARDSVIALREADVTVLAGTDSVAGAGTPFTIPHGVTLHHELELLVDAGYTPAEALHAATTGPARAFGLGDRGAVTPGLRADLLLIDGDPTTDITSTRNISGVWIAGTRIR